METKTDLQRIQANLNVPKNQRNEFAKFNYRSCEDILQALKPLLDELNCTLTLTDKIKVVGSAQAGVVVQSKKQDEPDRVDFNTRFYVVATAKLTDSLGNVTKVKGYAREAEHRKGMDESQLTGSTSSYARKLALSGLFLLDDNRDPDAVYDITEAEADAFSDLIEAGEGAKIFLMQATDNEKYMALVKRVMPKAGRVKFKENLRELVNQAVATAQTASVMFMELIDKDDEHGIREAWDEYTREEQQIIWRQFNPAQQDQMTALLAKTRQN